MLLLLVRENLSTDSIVYKQAESAYLSITGRKDLCTYTLLPDLCT